MKLNQFVSLCSVKENFTKSINYCIFSNLSTRLAAWLPFSYIHSLYAAFCLYRAGLTLIGLRQRFSPARNVFTFIKLYGKMESFVPGRERNNPE